MDRYRCHRLSVAHDAGVVAELRVSSATMDSMSSPGPLERIDVLAALVLHEGFTVNWDFDVD